jgi:gamma-glutamyltranspeptidase/glutathione hydrolase
MARWIVRQAALVVQACSSLLLGAPAPPGAVVSYHPEATRAGERILGSGGNAFDAFVAATMAEYVVAEGGTSIAGPLGALVYESRTRKLAYLDADMNDVRARNGKWTRWDAIMSRMGFDRSGKAVVVPGAVAGLEALSNHYGRLKFAEVIQPAIELARDGFRINTFYEQMIEWRADVLRKSEYGRRTFFRDGRPLKAGEILKQPVLANFLMKVAQQGSSYMYRGDWARQCVEAVRAKNGKMTLEDLASYKAAWAEPWKITYRGSELYSSSARNYGGLWANLALLALENTELEPLGHYSVSADALETVVRTAREVWGETWIIDPKKLDDRSFVEAKLTRDYGRQIWGRVKAKLVAPVSARRGSHSYHIIVADAQGNVVTGTNTIQSLPWGDGIFVEGIPLNQGGLLPSASEPGERRLNGLSMHIVMRDGQFRFATGAITNSLVEANYQFLLNLIDYRLPPDKAVSLPRFGTFPHDFEGNVDWSSNWLDPEIPASVVREVEKRGLKFKRDGPLICTGLDTGLGAVLAALPGGRVEGAVAPWPGLTAPLRSCAAGPMVRRHRRDVDQQAGHARRPARRLSAAL